MKQKRLLTSGKQSYEVRMEGLEPPRREAPDPKSGAATNYATCAITPVFRQQNLKFRIK